MDSCRCNPPANTVVVGDRGQSVELHGTFSPVELRAILDQLARAATPPGGPPGGPRGEAAAIRPNSAATAPGPADAGDCVAVPVRTVDAVEAAARFDLALLYPVAADARAPEPHRKGFWLAQSVTCGVHWLLPRDFDGSAAPALELARLRAGHGLTYAAGSTFERSDGRTVVVMAFAATAFGPAGCHVVCRVLPAGPIVAVPEADWFSRVVITPPDGAPYDRARYTFLSNPHHIKPREKDSERTPSAPAAELCGAAAAGP